MNRYLLNTYPTWVLAVLVVGGAMLIAATGLIAVRRRLPHFAEGEHNDVAGMMLGVVGAVYGIVLAFVIVAVYEDFKGAEANVRGEATEVAQLYRVTYNLDGLAQPMERAISEYVHDVVNEEPALMSVGQLSEHAWADLDAMYVTLGDYQSTNDTQASFLAAALDKLDGVVTARRARLSAAREELPETLQILLVGGALLLIGFTWFFGMSNFRAQMLLVLGVAALVGFNLLIALLIDHPFSGEVTVSMEPFKEGFLARLWVP